jgi:hypothetical protein
MSQPKAEQPALKMKNAETYREGYANSVQVRMSVWDFQLVFGTAKQDAVDEVTLENFQGVYLSPQQAKALWNVLGQNLAQYEQTFGKLALEPRGGTQTGMQIVVPPQPGGPVN